MRAHTSLLPAKSGFPQPRTSVVPNAIGREPSRDRTTFFAVPPIRPPVASSAAVSGEPASLARASRQPEGEPEDSGHHVARAVGSGPSGLGIALVGGRTAAIRRPYRPVGRSTRIRPPPTSRGRYAEARSAIATVAWIRVVNPPDAGYIGVHPPQGARPRGTKVEPGQSA